MPDEIHALQQVKRKGEVLSSAASKKTRFVNEFFSDFFEGVGYHLILRPKEATKQNHTGSVNFPFLGHIWILRVRNHCIPFCNKTVNDSGTLKIVVISLLGGGFNCVFIFTPIWGNDPI